MSLEKQWKMVQKLAQRTEAGEVDWKGTVNENAFQVSFSSYTLILKEISNSESEALDYEVRLLNELGETADTFNDVVLQQEFGSQIIKSSDRPYSVLKRLFAAARRKALGADKIIDSILLDLDDIPF